MSKYLLVYVSEVIVSNTNGLDLEREPLQRGEVIRPSVSASELVVQNGPAWMLGSQRRHSDPRFTIVPLSLDPNFVLKSNEVTRAARFSTPGARSPTSSVVLTSCEVAGNVSMHRRKSVEDTDQKSPHHETTALHLGKMMPWANPVRGLACGFLAGPTLVVLTYKSDTLDGSSCPLELRQGFARRVGKTPS